MRVKMATDTADLLFALSDILDLASPKLAKHQQRVALIAWLISKHIEVMDQNRREGLFVAAMLHDVGELSTEGKIRIVSFGMTPQELKGHCEIGAHLFSLLPWLNPVKEIVRNHHTDWNNRFQRAIVSNISAYFSLT